MLDKEQFKSFQEGLDAIFGKGATTCLYLIGNKQCREVKLPGENYRPLTDEEIKKYEALRERFGAPVQKDKVYDPSISTNVA